jgi:hypothetical protein
VYYIFAWAGSQKANKFGHCRENCPKKVEKWDLGYTGIKNMPPPQKRKVILFTNRNLGDSLTEKGVSVVHRA